jgi:hypothetical protein
MSKIVKPTILAHNIRKAAQAAADNLYQDWGAILRSGIHEELQTEYDIARTSVAEVRDCPIAAGGLHRLRTAEVRWVSAVRTADARLRAR